MKVIARFAPSPSGGLHIGNFRIFLVNFIFVKKHKGSLILRIEDTGNLQKIYSNKAIENILSLFKENKFNFDKVFQQSKRTHIYLKYVLILLKNKYAYFLNGAVYIDVQKYKQKTIFFNDLIFGKIEVKKENIEDFVILRSDRTPTFYLSNAIDDLEMNITHVIRGSDHISNTLKSKIIYEYLGELKPIIYVHLPLIHTEFNKKISKRENNDIFYIEKLLSKGFIIEGLINYLLRIGWGFKNIEIFSLKEIIKLFELKQLKKSSSLFNEIALKHINSIHIKKKTTIELSKLFILFLKKNNLFFTIFYIESILLIVETFRNRVQTLLELYKESIFIIEVLGNVFYYNEIDKFELMQILKNILKNENLYLDKEMCAKIRFLITKKRIGLNIKNLMQLVSSKLKIFL